MIRQRRQGRATVLEGGYTMRDNVEVRTGASGDTTVRRLIEAAERRIAEVGVDAASMRAINADAGVNVAAAHYHFGSKQALVRAVLAHRMSELAARRDRHLAALASAAEPALDAVAGAFVRPLQEIAREKPWGRTYLNFLAALARAAPPWRELLAEQAALHRAAFDAELARSLPGLPRDVLRTRFGWAALTVVTALADAADPGDTPTVADDLVDYICGALGAPVHREPRG
ncbi:TetR/AcrR family transcriptional regulator [Embleya sp. NPDC008237]|uniref:TetR/AcrR family transcriptional regulator n=1 Tax=Embleya sp. NPDC008237 TaxID=3363978 RepID=UPI0036E27E61